MPFGFKHTDSEQLDHRTPLKTARMDDASVVRDIAAETVTFQYDNGGVLASATGQAAGTLIYAKLVHDGLLDEFKEAVGDHANTGFSFVTGTVLTTLQQYPDEREIAGFVDKTTTERFTRAGEFLTTNGTFVIDHINGAIWGRAAAVVADDTCGYSVKTPITSSGTVAADVNVTELGGNAIDLNTGVVGAGTQRVTLATDVELPAGTNTIGDVQLVQGANTADVDANGNQSVRNFSGLVSEEHDFIGLTYTGIDLTTVTYRTGGAGGTIVGTLTLAYTSNVLDSVTRT